MPWLAAGWGVCGEGKGGWVAAPPWTCQYFHCCSLASQKLPAPAAITMGRYLAAPFIPEGIWQNCPSLSAASALDDLFPPQSLL